MIPAFEKLFNLKKKIIQPRLHVLSLSHTHTLTHSLPWEIIIPQSGVRERGGRLKSERVEIPFSYLQSLI